MKNYRLINNITGWGVFAVAAFTFLSTIEPTASLWDCGEFIASGFKLEVGHAVAQEPGQPVVVVRDRQQTDEGEVGGAVPARRSVRRDLHEWRNPSDIGC